MADITVLGDGIAALAITYHAVLNNMTVKVISANGRFAKNYRGGRFIYQPNDGIFKDLVKLVDPHYTSGPLGGGVALYTDGPTELHTWESLVSDKVLAGRVVHLYSDTTGRPWSQKLLNNILEWDKVPQVISTPYQLLANHMLYTVGKLCHLVDFYAGLVRYVSTDCHNLTYSSVEGGSDWTCPYKHLVSTIPAYIFGGLVDHAPVAQSMVDLDYTSPRFCRADVLPDHFILPSQEMLYFIGDKVEEKTGLPIKRRTCIPGWAITEFSSKPKIKGIHILPPNIPDISCAQSIQMENELAASDIHLLGRFSQMKSKMMMSHIVTDSYELINKIGA